MQNETSPSSGKLVTFISMGLGVPVAFAAYIFDLTKGNILLIALLFVIYEVVVLIFGIVASVGGILKGRWAEKLADCIDRKFQEIFSRYYKRYMKNIFYQYRDFDVKGMSTQGTYTLDVNEVFVELRIAPGFVHSLSSNILENDKPLKSAEESKDIWAFIKSDQKNIQNSLVIIGAPGSGKTTLLRHIALTYSSGKKYRQKFKIKSKVPILFYLRDYAETIAANPETTFLQIVEKQMEKWNLPFLKSWFDGLLKAGSMAILMDGLDEVADLESRGKLSAWIEQQIRNYGNNLFILSSRPNGYRENTIGGATVLEVRPFNRSQVETFIRRWYMAIEIMSHNKNDLGVNIAAEKGAYDLISRIANSSALAALSVNPLLLTMIATVHRYKSSLPGRRVELYDEICEVFLGRRQQAKGLALDLTPGQKKGVLQALAYWLMINEVREFKPESVRSKLQEPVGRVRLGISVEEFLKMVEESSGILVERENGVFAFAHLTFQEYLCAVYIAEEKLEKELLSKIDNSWWHEVIRLYVARTNATEIIRECIKQSGTSSQILALCIECVEEAREVEPEVRMQLDKILEEGIEDSELERRKIVAKAVLDLRIKNMIRIDNDRAIDNYYITNSEYQLFLDDMRIQGSYFQPDHWKEYIFGNGKGLQPVTGVRPSDAEAFCQWLTEKNCDGYMYRLPDGNMKEEIKVDDRDDSKRIYAVKAPGFWSRKGETMEFIKEEDLHEVTMEIIKRQLEDDISRFSKEVDYDRVNDSAIARALDSAIALDSAPGLDSAIAYALDSAYALDRTLDFTLGHHLDRTLAFGRILDRTFDFALALDRTLARAIARDHERVISRALALDRTLARPIARARERAIACTLDRDHDRTIDLALVRSLTFIRCILLLDIEYTISVEKKLKTYEHTVDILECQKAIEDYMDLYISFVVLEKRRDKQLPAVEGIRIVREKKYA